MSANLQSPTDYLFRLKIDGHPFLQARARIKEMLAQGRESTALSTSPPPPGTALN